MRRLVLAALAVAFLTAAAPAHAVVNGKRSTRIPTWMAAVVTDDERPHCSGSLIAPDKVLTAAHCATVLQRDTGPPVDPDDYRVTIRRSSSGSDADGSLHRIKEIAVHPRYAIRYPFGSTSDIFAASAVFDVAVLTLEQPSGQRPIGLAKRDPSPRSRVGIFGYGRFNDRLPPRLHEGTLRVLTDTTCTRAFNAAAIKRHMLCAKDPTGPRNRFTDTCSGDSGGPLVTSGGRVAGVLSFGGEIRERPCGWGLPAVYMSVADVRAWILSR